MAAQANPKGYFIMTYSTPLTNPPLRLLTAINRSLDPQRPNHMFKLTQREMWVAAQPTARYWYRIEAPDLKRSVQFSHRSAKCYQSSLRRPLGRWARYVAGVVVQLGDDGLPFPPFHMVVIGDEPLGPRYAFGMGLATARLCFELADLTATDAMLFQIVEQVRRDYLHD